MEVNLKRHCLLRTIPVQNPCNFTVFSAPEITCSNAQMNLIFGNGVMNKPCGVHYVVFSRADGVGDEPSFISLTSLKKCELSESKIEDEVKWQKLSSISLIDQSRVRRRSIRQMSGGLRPTTQIYINNDN